EGQPAWCAAAGPPCARTTIGAFVPDAGGSGGARSQPWTVSPSEVQASFFAAPHDVGADAFACVSGVHAPIRPAHTSRGAPKDSRIAAVVLPSRATATPVRRSAETCSEAVWIVAIAPPSRETVAKPDSPPTSSPKRRVAGEIHSSVAADAF